MISTCKKLVVFSGSVLFKFMYRLQLTHSTKGYPKTTYIVK